MLVIDGVKYHLWTPTKEEKEFHPMVRAHSKEIFGENSIYFDVKLLLKSASGIGSIPDAYVINLSKPYEWCVIENELSTHDLYSHIVDQLSRFISGIKNPTTKNSITDLLYDEINKDEIMKATVRKLIDTEDIHHFLSKLLSAPPRFVVVIEERTRETEEACQTLGISDIIEFKTFVKENDENSRAHLFEPLNEVPPPPPPPERHNWEEKLAWVDPPVRELVDELTKKITLLGAVTHRPSGRDYAFLKERQGSPSTCVAAFMLTKNALKIRIRTDPSTFKDPKKWTGDRIFKGWFFKTGQERGFGLTSKDQIDYAMELIKQSYNLAK